LRNFRKTKKTPVLILSARDNRPMIAFTGSISARTIISSRPFVLTELLARLRALIRRAAGQPQPTIEIGGRRHYPRTRTVKVSNGTAIEMTAREYAIVEMLAMQRGAKLVTRTQIYEHIFDENDDSLSNLIEVHVSNIRKKLGKDFIKTRRGLGYIIDD